MQKEKRKPTEIWEIRCFVERDTEARVALLLVAMMPSLKRISFILVPSERLGDECLEKAVETVIVPEPLKGQEHGFLIESAECSGRPFNSPSDAAALKRMSGGPRALLPPHGLRWQSLRMSAPRSVGNQSSVAPSLSDPWNLAPQIVVEPRMRSEEERFGTFQNWPRDAPVTAMDLARAGFYFVGPGDKVQCFCCGGVLRYWVHGDSPLGEHKRHFPTCPFVLGTDVGDSRSVPTSGSSDSVDGQLLSQMQRMTVDDQVLAGQAVYPEMEAEESRITTFHNWPTGSSVQPDVLARAGFFYTGHGDNVKCFYCDGGLRNWEPGDDPWQEHAKWFPRCEFLLQTRGREFVDNIQDSYFNISGPVSGLQTSARDISSGHDIVSSQDSAFALASPVVQSVLQMGFEPSIVESLVQTKYLLTGTYYTSVSDLVTDVLQAEEEDRQRSEQAQEQPAREHPIAGGDRIQTCTREKVVGDLSPEEQLRQLQEERTCKICMDKLVSIVFIPCGHLVVCTDCAASLRHCPICRAVIRGSVRAFMS